MPQGSTAGGIAVVIDVLRASTTIVTALANGAVGIRPTFTVAQARAAAAAIGSGTLLGGERGGVQIDSFDLGNSPREYSRQRVANRSIVITTTNGTAALNACRDARTVLIGALVNCSAVAKFAHALAVSSGIEGIHLVCAGTDGMATEEDLLAAGAILAVGAGLSADSRLDRSGQDALNRYRKTIENQTCSNEQSLTVALAASIGGINLSSLGMQDDIAFAALIDSLPVVPIWDQAAGWLLAAGLPLV